MMMLSLKMSLEDAVAFQMRVNPYFEEQWNRIIDTKYLDKELTV